MIKKHDKEAHGKNLVWNLKHLFLGDDDPRIEKQKKLIQKKCYAFINKWKGRKDYLKDPAVLKEALDDYELWMRNYGSDGNPGYYFWLRNSNVWRTVIFPFTPNSTISCS